MSDRIHLSRRDRVRIFDAAKGRCHICRLKIHAGRGEDWDIEHKIPLWLDGTNDLENLAPAHESCHQRKTSEESTDRAKTDRQRANYLGIERLGPKLPGGRRANISKKLNGEIVPRISGKGAKHRQTMAQFPNRRPE